MAKKRPSVQKRQREHEKRQRQLDKAAQKRERRLSRDEPGCETLASDGEVSSDANDEISDPGE